MSNLVLLSGERAKREQADQMKLIMGLQELLAMEERGEIKAVCFAAIDFNNDNVTLGVLRGEDTAIRWSNIVLIGRVAVMRQNIERPNGTEQSRARGVGLWIMDRIGSRGKTAMDEWIGEFEKRAGPRLRDIFESPRNEAQCA